MDPYLFHQVILMSLKYGRPDHPHDQAVQNQLDRLASQPGDQMNALAGAAPAELEMTEAHPVYVLGLDQVIAGADLSTISPIGWRYLLRQGGQTVAAAQTIVDAGKATFAQFNSGPFVPATQEALGQAEQYAGGEEGEDLEPRLVHVPALYAMALWLHGTDGAGDVILPIAPTPPGVAANRRYSVQDYLDALREAAATVSPVGTDDLTGG
jgi:hypothetical protein